MNFFTMAARIRGRKVSRRKLSRRGRPVVVYFNEEQAQRLNLFSRGHLVS